MKQMKNNKDGKSKTAKMKSERAKSLGRIQNTSSFHSLRVGLIS